jgi:hypothetical protein
MPYRFRRLSGAWRAFRRRFAAVRKVFFLIGVFAFFARSDPQAERSFSLAKRYSTDYCDQENSERSTFIIDETFPVWPR